MCAAKTDPGPLRLFLHWLPSSSHDWRGPLALLGGAETLALDFLGLSARARLSIRQLFVRSSPACWLESHRVSREEAEDRWVPALCRLRPL